MSVNAGTQLIGLLGWPVSHSLSPAMHNAATQALGIDWLYLPFPVHPDNLPAAVRGLRALGVRGVNVTVPHKQAVMPLLEAIDPAAQALGAVNTICFGATTVGYNTDWSGFLADLQAHQIEVQGRGCFILGAGGSARAVAYALASAGGRVHLLARRIAQAQEVAQSLSHHFPHEHLSYHALSELAQLAPQWAAPLIVNSTPLGMTPHIEQSPWPADVPFPRGAVLYDLVYNPATTTLMDQAQAAGCRAVNGLGMLVYQGAQALARWTGCEPDIAVMRQAVAL